MIVNAATLTAIGTNFKVIFNKALEDGDRPWQRLATTVPSTGKSESYPFGALTAQVREWLGDKAVTDLAAWADSLTNRDWEFTVGVDRNAIEDDNLGIYSPVLQSAAQEFSLHPHNLAMEVLNYDAFGTNTKGVAVTGFDGVPFFSASHTWPGAYDTAQSNLATGDLTQTNVDAADTAMLEFRRPNGDFMRSRANLLVIGTGLRATARALFLTARGTGGADNPMFGRFAKEEIIVDPRIRAGRWVMLDATRVIKPLVYQERKKPTFVSMVDATDEAVFMRREFRFGSEARYALAAMPWWLAYASDASATTTEAA